MSIQRKGPSYYAVFKVEGKQKWFRLSADEATAKSQHDVLSGLRALGVWNPATQDAPSLEEGASLFNPASLRIAASLKGRTELVDRFLQAKTNLEATSQSTYRCVLTLWLNESGDTTDEALAQWLASNGRRPATQRSYWSHIHPFLRWCLKHNLIAFVPEIVLPKRTHTRPAATAFEIMLIADRASQDASDAIRFAFLTGMRASEVCRLEVRDLQTARGEVIVRRAKSGGDDRLPVSLEALYIATGRPPNKYGLLFTRGGRPYTRYSLHRDFIAARDKAVAAGVIEDRGLVLHSTRHGFCTMMADKGASATQLKRAARHSDIKTSMGYVDEPSLGVRQYLPTLPSGRQESASGGVGQVSQ